jgi:ATP-dependent Clp protease, protease subunit
MTHEDKNPAFSERVREQLLLRRILVLDGVLDDDNGTLLATQLLTLAAEDPAADVALWINSPGGSVPSMLAIRDVMRLVPCDVSTLALGLACSAGQFLLSAGSKGKRFALPHARILMHRGSAGIGGSAVDIEVQADDLRHTVDTVLGLIAEDTGQPVERIFDDSLHDHWYTAEQCRRRPSVSLPADPSSGCGKAPQRRMVVTPCPFFGVGCHIHCLVRRCAAGRVRPGRWGGAGHAPRPFGIIGPR